MSLYAVQNDEGEWLGCEIYCDEPDWFDHGGFIWDTRSIAEENVKLYGGHVVTLIEEPEKVVLTKKQAEIVEDAHATGIPASYISGHSNVYNGEEILLMKAYVNGYTVEKEKKYNVKVPLVQAQGGLWFYINSEDKLDASYLQELAKKFTIDEIEHYGLQDCDRVEVTDDEQ